MDFSQGILQSCRGVVTLFAFFLLNCCWDFCSTARANSSRSTWKYHSANAISSKVASCSSALAAPLPSHRPQPAMTALSLFLSLSFPSVFPELLLPLFPEQSGPSPPAAPSPCASPEGQHSAVEVCGSRRLSQEHFPF